MSINQSKKVNSRNDAPAASRRETELLALIERALKRDKPSSLSAWLPFVAGLVGAACGLVVAYWGFISEDLDRHVKKTATQIAQADVIKKYLDEIRPESGYKNQHHAIRAIAEVYGPDTAIAIEKRFRTGATIRALEELQKWEKQLNQRKIPSVDESLATCKRVLIMDSKVPDNVYSKFTELLGGTNVEDIAFIIRDLPIRLIGIKIQKTWSDKNEQEIIEDIKPNLIILHLGSFDKVETKPVDEAEAVGLFIKKVSEELPDVRFIVYSRQGEPALTPIGDHVSTKVKDRIGFLPIPLGTEFATESNRVALRLAVSRKLDLDGLYHSSRK